MKTILASIIMMAIVLSGCTTVVMTESYEARPTTIVTEAYRAPVVSYTTQYCYWQETPVYGYADVYRDGYTRVRIKEVAYVDRQWRCH